MATHIPDPLRSIVKALNKIGKFRRRLEYETPVNICSEIHRTMVRVDVINKHVESLRNQLNLYLEKLNKINRLLWSYNFAFYLVFLLGVASIITVAFYTILYVFTVAALLMNMKVQSLTLLNVNPDTLRNPVVFLTILGLGALSIFTISLIIGNTYRKVIKRINRRELKAQRDNLMKTISSINWRLKVLEHRLMLDNEVKMRIHDVHRCLCYSEYLEIAGILHSLVELMGKLKVTSSWDEKMKVINDIYGVLSKIGARRVICPQPICEEYRFEITIDDSVFDFLSNVKQGVIEEKEGGLIKIRFSGSPLIYEADLTKTIYDYLTTS